jgi:hypothetical protein
MDPSFEPYFRDRLDQIGRDALTGAPPESFGLEEPGGPDPYEAAVFSAVERGIDESIPIRSDARLVLHLAFTELVAQPMRSVRASGADLNDVLEAIETDVTTITERALAGRDPGELLSAYDIVNAASRSWPELHTAGFGLWD